MNPPVNELVERALRDALGSQLEGLVGVTLSSEIQDRGEFLLLCVDVRDGQKWPEIARKEFLKTAARDLERELPKRDSDYRWMIVVRYKDEVIDSTMGGWAGKATV